MQLVLICWHAYAARRRYSRDQSSLCNPRDAETASYTTNLLADQVHSGELDEVVFKVAATIPLERREIGVEYDGFDANEFVKRLRDEANS